MLEVPAQGAGTTSGLSAASVLRHAPKAFAFFFSHPLYGWAAPCYPGLWHPQSARFSIKSGLTCTEFGT